MTKEQLKKILEDTKAHFEDNWYQCDKDQEDFEKITNVLFDELYIKLEGYTK